MENMMDKEVEVILFNQLEEGRSFVGEKNSCVIKSISKETSTNETLKLDDCEGCTLEHKQSENITHCRKCQINNYTDFKSKTNETLEKMALQSYTNEIEALIKLGLAETNAIKMYENIFTDGYKHCEKTLQPIIDEQHEIIVRQEDLEVKLNELKKTMYFEEEVYQLLLLKDKEYWKDEHNEPFNGYNEINSKEWFQNNKK